MELSKDQGDKWGDYITAASIINDAPMKLNGKTWPQNDYGGFRGEMTLRKAVQQSVNVVAVKVFRQVGIDYSIEMLQKVGISSLVLEGGTSDMHDALALGGMTKGISPLEMTAAYGTFANDGIYREPIFYTEVTDSKGNIIIENEQASEQVYDESVAWIMTDILKSAVQYGTGQNAKVEGWDVAGKTGTTSSKYDIWFSGFTPHYSMALWMGSDVNIALANYSSVAAAFWSAIMSDVCEGMPAEHFSKMPSSVVKVNGEYYAVGTEPKAQPDSTDGSSAFDSETQPSDGSADGADAGAENGVNNAPGYDEESDDDYEIY